MTDARLFPEVRDANLAAAIHAFHSLREKYFQVYLYSNNDNLGYRRLLIHGMLDVLEETRILRQEVQLDQTVTQLLNLESFFRRGH